MDWKKYSIYHVIQDCWYSNHGYPNWHPKSNNKYAGISGFYGLMTLTKQDGIVEATNILSLILSIPFLYIGLVSAVIAFVCFLITFAIIFAAADTYSDKKFRVKQNCKTSVEIVLGIRDKKPGLYG